MRSMIKRISKYTKIPESIVEIAGLILLSAILLFPQDYSYTDEGDNMALRVTVFNETELVDGVTTRIVEKEDTTDGERTGISGNLYENESR